MGLLEFPPVKNPPVVIMLHGLNSHKTYYSFMNLLADFLPKNGYAVLRFDFNTHGESEGDWRNFTRKSCVDDFRAAIEFLRTQKVDSNRIGVFATSMGAVAFMMNPSSIRAAVLHNPFILPSLWKQWISGHEEENRKRGYIELIQKKTGRKLKYGLPLMEESLNAKSFPMPEEMTTPTLLIFGEKDETTAKDREKTLNLFKGGKELKIIKGVGHDLTTSKQDKEIASLSLSWFKRYL